MATINAINSNIPIEVAKGGTNATSFATTDGVVYFDGTRLVTTAVGTATQVLTSNGAAVAPTFQAPTGAMIVLSQQSATSSASITFTSSVITSTYGNYFLTITQLQPATGSTTLNMDWSTNNGISYLSTNYTSGVVSHAYNSATWANVNSTATSPLSDAGITNTGYYAAYIQLFNLGAAQVPFAMGQFYHDTTAGDIISTNTGTTAINNIKFSMSAGNITTGIFTLYGLVN